MTCFHDGILDWDRVCQTCWVRPCDELWDIVRMPYMECQKCCDKLDTESLFERWKEECLKCHGRPAKIPYEWCSGEAQMYETGPDYDPWASEVDETEYLDEVEVNYCLKCVESDKAFNSYIFRDEKFIRITVSLQRILRRTITLRQRYKNLAFGSFLNVRMGEDSLMQGLPGDVVELIHMQSYIMQAEYYQDVV
jgi:hypothetical protein